MHNPKFGRSRSLHCSQFNSGTLRRSVTLHRRLDPEIEISGSVADPNAASFNGPRNQILEKRAIVTFGPSGLKSSALFHVQAGRITTAR